MLQRSLTRCRSGRRLMSTSSLLRPFGSRLVRAWHRIACGCTSRRPSKSRNPPKPSTWSSACPACTPYLQACCVLHPPISSTNPQVPETPVRAGFLVLGVNSTTDDEPLSSRPRSAGEMQDIARITVLSIARAQHGEGQLRTSELARTVFRSAQVTALCAHGPFLLAAVGCTLTALQLWQPPQLLARPSAPSPVLRRMPQCDKVGRVGVAGLEWQGWGTTQQAKRGCVQATLQPVTLLTSQASSACVVAGDDLHSVAVYRCARAGEAGRAGV